MTRSSDKWRHFVVESDFVGRNIPHHALFFLFMWPVLTSIKSYKQIISFWNNRIQTSTLVYTSALTKEKSWQAAGLRSLRPSPPRSDQRRPPDDPPDRSPHLCSQWRPQTNAGREPLHRPLRQSEPASLEVVHKTLHAVELGRELSQLVFQGVELPVEVTEGIWQGLDPGWTRAKWFGKVQTSKLFPSKELWLSVTFPQDHMYKEHCLLAKKNATKRRANSTLQCEHESLNVLLRRNRPIICRKHQDNRHSNWISSTRLKIDDFWPKFVKITQSPLSKLNV